MNIRVLFVGLKAVLAVLEVNAASVFITTQ